MIFLSVFYVDYLQLLDMPEAGNKFNEYGQNVALLRCFKSAFSFGFVEVG